jgi:hypothetical protein
MCIYPLPVGVRRIEWQGIPFADLSRFEKILEVADSGDLFTVDLIAR